MIDAGKSSGVTFSDRVEQNRKRAEAEAETWFGRAVTDLEREKFVWSIALAVELQEMPPAEVEARWPAPTDMNFAKGN